MFFWAPVRKFQKTSTSVTKQSRFIKNKKLLRKDTLWVSEAVIQKCCVKKLSLKTLPHVYLHIIETDIR